MNYEHYLSLAREAAKDASYSGPSKVKLGCVAVYHGSVLAKGCNSDKTHTMQARFNYLRYDTAAVRKYCPDKMHAEMDCLNRLKYLDIDFSKVTLFVYREFKDGTPALARPCNACLAAAKSLGVRTITYSTPNGYAIEHLK